MKNHLKVEGYSNLVRDDHNGAIINTDFSEYQKYIAMREAKTKEKEQVKTIEEEIDQLKSDINEIKFLLRSLVE
jgi:hypothetical protein